MVTYPLRVRRHVGKRVDVEGDEEAAEKVVCDDLIELGHIQRQNV